MREAYVELVGLGKRFGTVAAVSGVSLAVPEGRVTTLLGPSGCGKTTLLRLIAGFIGRTRVRSGSGQPGQRDPAPAAEHGRRVPGLRAVPAPERPENVAYGLAGGAAARSHAAGPGRWPPRAGRPDPLSPHNCRAASSSGWRWPGRWSSSRTSPPGRAPLEPGRQAAGAGADGAQGASSTRSA